MYLTVVVHKAAAEMLHVDGATPHTLLAPRGSAHRWHGEDLAKIAKIKRQRPLSGPGRGLIQSLAVLILSVNCGHGGRLRVELAKILGVLIVPVLPSLGAHRLPHLRLLLVRGELVLVLRHMLAHLRKTNAVLGHPGPVSVSRTIGEDSSLNPEIAAVDATGPY